MLLNLLILYCACTFLLDYCLGFLRFFCFYLRLAGYESCCGCPALLLRLGSPFREKLGLSGDFCDLPKIPQRLLAQDYIVVDLFAFLGDQHVIVEPFFLVPAEVIL